MAKKDRNEKKEYKEEAVKEMTVEEARALRMARHNATVKEPSEQEKREEFRLFWAQEKSKYGKDKALESILWLHIKAMNMDTPDKFKRGLEHFGLKEIK